MKNIRNRESNLELLRIISILFVITLHYCYRFIFNNSNFNILTLNNSFIHIMESTSICAVNIFLLISGYFQGSKANISIKKIFILFVEVILLNFMEMIIRGVLTSKHPGILNILYCFLPRNYYVWIYCAVYLFSPFVNKLLFSLTDTQYKKMVLCIFLTFFFIPTVVDFFADVFKIKGVELLSPVSQNGNGGGYTFVNFLCMYVIGASINRYRKIFQERKFLPFFTYFFSTCIIFVFSFVSLHAFDYCNFFVVFQAVSLFCIFINFQVKSKFINFIAGYVFEVYLIHGFFIALLYKKVDIDDLINFSIAKFISFSLLIIFLICIFSFLTAFIFKQIMKCFDFIFQKIHFLQYKLEITTTE